MEQLTSLFEGIDIKGMIPSAESLVSGLTGWMVLLVLIGPVLMLGFGIFYMFFSPKEANHILGYRFFYAMSRVEVWQHAQRLAGIAYTAVGGLLLIIMGVICFSFGRLAAPDLVWRAAKCLIWEVVLSIIATLAVDILIMVLYDIKGTPRKSGKRVSNTKKRSPQRARR